MGSRWADTRRFGSTATSSSIRMDIQPNVLTRKLNVGVDRLWNEYHIRYESSRTHAGRNIKLTLKVSET